MTTIELVVSGVILGCFIYAVLRQRLSKRNVPWMRTLVVWWIVWLLADWTYLWYSYLSSRFDTVTETPAGADIELRFSVEELAVAGCDVNEWWAPQCGG